MPEAGEMNMATEAVIHDIHVFRVRRSESTANLDEALAKAIAEFQEVKKENNNPFYKSKYADLSCIISATRAALSKHGVTVRQWPYTVNGRAGVTTRITFGGEWEESDFDLPVSKQDAQGVGSAITYARRYAYQAILNVAAELDDDANAAVGKRTEDVLNSLESAEKSASSKMADQERIEQGAAVALDKTWAKSGWTADQVSAYLKSVDAGYAQCLDVRKGDFWEIKRKLEGPPPVPQTAEAIVDAGKKSVDILTARKKSNAHARLFAVAKSRNVSEDDFRRYAKESLGVDHLSELTPLQEKQLVEWMETV